MSMKIPPAWKEEGKKLGLAALKAALNNWGFKLLALFRAVVLWAGLISQAPTLTREKTFENVTINLTNTESLKRNGLIVVTDLSSQLKNATLEADVPQMQYDNAQGSYYNARMDLSRITQTGVQEVRVLTTSSSTYGTVTSTKPATLQIEVDEYITRYRIPTAVEVVGEPPEGFYAASPTLDPPVVAVSGPRSLVEKIVRAEVVLDQSGLPAREGTVRTAAQFSLVDKDGKAIESSMLEITSESVLLDSVILEQQLYSYKTIALGDLALVSGTPASGYEVKSVTVTPAQVTVAARSAVLDNLGTVYPEGSVSVDGVTESFTQQVKVRKPSGVVSLSSDSITVAVEIGPVIQSKSFGDMRLETVGTEDGFKCQLSYKYAGVTVQGPKLWVDELRSNSITLICNVSGLGEGVYEIPVICEVKDDEGQTYTVEIVPETVTATITAE